MGMPGQGTVRYMPQAVDPMQVLAEMQKINIKEKVQMAEILVGFEMPNKYILSNELGYDCFVAGEKSAGILGHVGRQVFEGGQRPFEMDIGTLNAGNEPIPFAKLQRPFACTCCCFGRPEMKVLDAQGNLVGTIQDPFACCSITMSIHDRTGQEVLKFEHSVCDCALMCWGCPCGCQQVEIAVMDAQQGNQVATIKKVMSMAQGLGMIGGINVDADNYVIEFGQIQHPEWKLLLIALALFLDTRWFTQGGSEARENSVLGRVMEMNRD